MAPEPHCPRCGNLLAPGQADCPACKRLPGGALLERDTVLLLSFVLLVPFFVVAGFVSRSYHAKRAALAQEWHARAQAKLQAGQAEPAIRDLQTALVYAPDSSAFRLGLAQALISAGRTEEGRAYLMSLWREEPGNGVVNLELARLAVKGAEVTDALRYFHNAIYGVWNTDPPARRREARFEMCAFLVGVGEKEEAQSELVPLAADLPSDPALHLRVAKLFLQAGDFDRALRQFRSVLKLKPGNAEALGGAGRAEFEGGDYAGARRFLQQAVSASRDNSEAAQLLELVNLILSIDPYDPRLGAAEKARRTVRAFQQASARLESCQQAQPGAGQIASLRQRVDALRPRVRESRLRRDADLVTATLEIVFEVEEQTSGVCGNPAGLDRALRLLGRKYRGSAP